MVGKDRRVAHLEKLGFITERDLAKKLGLSGVWPELRTKLTSKYKVEMIILPTQGSKEARLYANSSVQQMMPKWEKDKESAKIKTKTKQGNGKGTKAVPFDPLRIGQPAKGQPAKKVEPQKTSGIPPLPFDRPSDRHLLPQKSSWFAEFEAIHNDIKQIKEFMKKAEAFMKQFE